MAYEEQLDHVRRAFAAELTVRGLNFATVDDQRLSVTMRDGSRRIISLVNFTRAVANDGFDASRVRAWLDVALPGLSVSLGWPEVGSFLRWSAEPSDINVGDAYRLPVSPHMSRFLVSVEADEEWIGFITCGEMRGWAVESERLTAIAAANLDVILDRTELRVQEGAGHPLGFFETASVSKASLIFAPSLAAKLAPTLGWPMLAVAPARDFVLFFAEAAAAELVPRLGPVVAREYTQSPYPVTAEVLRIGDDGVVAVGSYAVRDER